MAFKLEHIVPWGRNLNEYRLMFNLNDSDMSKKIAGFGDGPASFNYEAAQQGYSVTSFDPIYQFSKNDLQKRIGEVRITVMELFLSDYVQGKTENFEFHLRSSKGLERSSYRSVFSDVTNKNSFPDRNSRLNNSLPSGTTAEEFVMRVCQCTEGTVWFPMGRV